MRPSIAVLTLLIATSIVSFSAAGAAAQETEPKTYHLSGKVVNAATGEPVAGALLRVSAAGKSPAQFSGSDGHFVFADVPSGQYPIWVRKPGFFSAQEMNSFHFAQDMANVPGDETIVKLYPEGTIYGEVKGENGEPVEGIAVKAERWRVNGGRKQLEIAGQGLTDDEGNYRIAELRPGDYILRFEPEGRGIHYQRPLRTNYSGQGFGSQFYPGVPDRASAGEVKIKAGTQAHISQTVSQQRLYEVSGSIRGRDPTTGVGIILTDEEGDVVQRDMAFDRRTGAFQIPDVPAGVYALTATSWPRSGYTGPPPNLPRAAMAIRVNANVTGLILTLGTGAYVKVAVHDEIRNAGSAENVHRASVRMTLNEFNREMEAAIAPPMAPQGDVISGLLAGTYRVEASPMQMGYVAELRCGSVDLLRDDLVIPPGGAPPPIEVTLRDDGAQLEVGVSGKEAREYGSVVIYSDEEPRRSVLMRTTGGNSVTAGNLAPGHYYVFAVSGTEDPEIENSTAMEKYLDKATSVLLGPNDKSSVRVEMQGRGATEE